jgi:hypothetical protein
MGLTFAAGSTAGTPPDIEKGIFDARFDGVVEKTDVPSQYGNSDVFVWAFTLFADGEAIYDEGEPVTVERMTSQSVNTKSKTTPGAVKVLRALMTDGEYARFEAEQPVPADDLIGRMVQVQVIIKENGWPKVEDVFPAKKAGRRARAS